MGERQYDIRVKVESEYLPEQSSSEDQRYVFAYHVAISNQGQQRAQLLTRHWVITDGNQHVQEVRGEGVIGEQPIIAPGDTYTYSSGTVIATPVGSMHGSYQMRADDGTTFDAAIPPFTLAQPRSLH